MAKPTWNRAFMIFYSRNKTKQKNSKIDFTCGFDSYVNEIVNPITDNRDDLHTHSVSKFLFHHFSNLMQDLDKDSYKIRYYHLGWQTRTGGFTE